MFWQRPSLQRNWSSRATHSPSTLQFRLSRLQRRISMDRGLFSILTWRHTVSVDRQKQAPLPPRDSCGTSDISPGTSCSPPRSRPLACPAHRGSPPPGPCQPPGRRCPRYPYIITLWHFDTVTLWHCDTVTLHCDTELWRYDTLQMTLLQPCNNDYFFSVKLYFSMLSYVFPYYHYYWQKLGNQDLKLIFLFWCLVTGQSPGWTIMVTVVKK